MEKIGGATELIVKTGNPPAFKQEGFHGCSVLEGILTDPS